MGKELDFQEVSSKIMKMEKSLLSYKPYSGEVSLELGIKISPSEYSALGYHDLLNFYERIEKIRKTSEIVRGVSPKRTKEVEEVEVAIKEISKDHTTLEVPDVEVAPILEKEEHKKLELKFEDLKPETKTEVKTKPKQVIPEEKPAEKKPEKKLKVEKKEEPEKKPELEVSSEEIEIPAPDFKETKKPEKELELDVPAPSLAFDEETHEDIVSPVVFESVLKKKKEEKDKLAMEKKLKEKPLFSPEIPKERVEIPYILSHEHPKISQFPSIEQDPNEVGIKRYQELAKRMDSSSGKMSNREIKSQMLTLTKQLFKEKLTSERERIKKEIIRLKNLLSSSSKVKKMDFRTILKSLPDEFLSEVLEYLTSMNNIIVNSIKDSNIEFHTAVLSVPQKDRENRRKAFELFSSDLKSIESQANEFSKKTSSFLVKLHVSILGEIKKSGTAVESKMCDDVLSRIEKDYSSQFEDSFKYIQEYLELVRVKALHDSEVSENNDLKFLFESMELNEEQLLNYLQSKHSKKYDLYMNKEISKLEAVSYARKLFSKEKGLSNELLSKYFVSG